MSGIRWEAHVVVADVSKEEEATALTREAALTFGKIKFGSIMQRLLLLALEDIPEKDFRRVIDISGDWVKKKQKKVGFKKALSINGAPIFGF